MEINKFKDSLIRYYKEHQSEYVQKVVLRYVESQYDSNKYETLLQAVLKSHPFNYGFPDVAAIEEAGEKYYKKDGFSLRKQKNKSSWTTEEKELTKEERKQAEENRGKWKALVRDATKNSKVKQDKTCQTCTHKTETGENFFCRGCVGHNKYQEI